MIRTDNKDDNDDGDTSKDTKKTYWLTMFKEDDGGDRNDTEVVDSCGNHVNNKTMIKEVESIFIK